MTLAPRLLTSVVSAGEPPLGDVWRDTRVELPEGAPSVWRNVFTGEVSDCAGTVPVADALARFPVSLLTGE